MIILPRYPVSELRTCQPHTTPNADRLARCMHWRDDAGQWRCETMHPYTVEAPQESAPADPPSQQAQTESPASVESRDVAHAEAGGSSNDDGADVLAMLAERGIAMVRVAPGVKKLIIILDEHAEASK